MCGIAGVLYFDSRRVCMSVLRSMGNAIAHRGPDAEGYFSAPSIGLVHRRLSIIDLQGGDQPIPNEDESLQVVFNGELYNYQALRRSLQQRGHKFRTASDTECLVHLYEEKGPNLVHSLRGMFAFALWDQKKRRLTLARDRLGIKPLYYFADGEKFIFASELKSILAHPDVPRVLDLQSFDAYLSMGMVPGTRSIYRNIYKLASSHNLTVDLAGKVTTSRYWAYQPCVDASLSADECVESVSAKLQETVKSHMVADVPVGAFLSGGVDSTVVASVASNITSSPLHTFSIGFSSGQRSELPVARETSQRLRSQHIESVVKAECQADLDLLVETFDEPFADSSAIPTMRVAKLAAEHVKVVLSGDGGDECFGGYSRYVHDLSEARLRARLPRWFRKLLLGPLAHAWPQFDWLPRVFRAKSFLTNISSPPSLAYSQTISSCSVAKRNQLYSSSTRSALHGWNAEKSLAENFEISGIDPLAGMIAADFNCLLPDAFLVKVDRASMAYGLEVRPPMVDHELVELASTIPSEFKIRNKETKWILKESMAHFLPDSLLTQPKQGFEIPLNAWFAGPLADSFRSTVLESTSSASHLFDTRALRSMLAGHERGHKKCGQTLWNVLVFVQWFDRYRPELPST